MMSILKKNWWVLIGILALMPGMVQAGEGSGESRKALELTLRDAVELGLSQNPKIKAMEFAIEKSRSETKSVRGRFFPRLSAGYSHTWLESIDATGPTDADYLNQVQETWRVSLQQPLYAGKTILNTYLKAQIQEQAAGLEKENEERRLIRKIQEKFLQLLKAREDRRSLEQTVERLHISYQAAKAFVAQQMAPYVEVLQAQVELENAQQKLSQAKNIESISATELGSLLGLTEDLSVSYAGNLADIDLSREVELSQCQQTASQERIELKFIQTNIQLAEKEKQIADGQKLPRVNLQVNAVDYGRDYDKLGSDLFGRPYDRDQTNQYWTAGVSVEWNFFSGGKDYYRAQSMENEIRRLERLLDDTTASIRTEVKSAYLRLQEARQRVDATRYSLGTAGEGYRMEKKRLEMRVGTIQALLDAQDRLTRSDANLNMAMLDYQLALADLYYSMGIRNYALN